MHRLPLPANLVFSVLFALPSCSSSESPPYTPPSLCPLGTTACGAECKNLTSDAANCGLCGNACPGATSCVNASCVCASGLTSCPSGCADLASNAGNCGGCGIVCAAGQVCSAGACKASCDAGLMLCGQSCVNAATSVTDCGTCGNACPAGLSCNAGVCGCTAPLQACGTECVDWASNPLHCGGCNISCGAGQSCSAGSCVGGGTGGAGSGGTSGSGGDVSGGAPTGGVPSGGAPGGGAPSGGAPSGGTPSGGAPTGGVGTGGAGSGGTPPGTLNGCTATIPDATLEQEYTRWRAAYVVECSATMARVQAGGNAPGSASSETFSEGIGYGMLLAVTFDDRATFDKLWAYYKDSLDPLGLMHWKMNACTGNYYEANAASDGDLDTAMALVMADRRWGGYAADATGLLALIRQHETLTCGALTVLKPGDAWGACNTGSFNPSYFSPGYYRAFASFQPDQASFWNKFADDSITMLLDYQAEAGGALMGEWAYTDRLADTSYGYNACRTPWRVAMDYAWFGTAGAQTYLTNVSSYVDARGGVASVPFDKNSAFLGPFALSGIATGKCDAYYQSWMSGAQWDDRYFQGTLRVLALALMAGKFVY